LGLVLSLLTVFLLPVLMYAMWRKASPKRAKALLVGMVLALLLILTAAGVLAYIHFATDYYIF